MNIGIVVQARHSSVRLPGKVLRPVNGTPLLGWLFERLCMVKESSTVILATSDRRDDDPVARFGADNGVLVHRGPLDDVLARFAGAAAAHGLDVLVRVSGDSPLLDPAIVSRAIRMFGEGGADLVTNVQERSFPKGQSVEVVSSRALRDADAAATDAADREHVTPYFYARPERFVIRNFTAEPPAPEMRLCVDTAEDLALLERIAARMTRPQREYGLEELVRLQRQAVADLAVQ